MLKSDDLYIVYDGQCPFCANYIRLIRLREIGGGVHLVDARSSHPAKDFVLARNIDLNEGMAAILGGRIYWGDECINFLALMSTPSGAFNRLNRLIFSSPKISRALYPWLSAGRRLTLKLLNRPEI